MTMKLKLLFAFVILLVIAALCPGCAGGLETGGAYAQANTAPDKALFTADLTFKTLHAQLTAVFDFERDNRLLCWQISPEIKHSLDRLRPKASAIVKEYAQARAAYLKAPAPANLTSLQGVLAELSRLNATAATVLNPKSP